MTLYKWSQTPSANATADSTINWMEGQAPSSVNDSARSMMTAIAKYRDDVAGAIVTGGSNTSYTLSTFQLFQSLSKLDGQLVAFTPHITNGAMVTLNVDGLGAKPLRSAPGSDLMSGVLVQGTPYQALYNATDGAFYLFGIGSTLAGNPYNIPLLGGIDYWHEVTPNSSFIFPLGQAISRTTYAAAFALWGTRFGAGDGSTTFNVPNKAGRVSAMVDASLTVLHPAYFGGDPTVIGKGGGSQAHTLTEAEMPSHYHSAGIYDPGHVHGQGATYAATIGVQGGGTYPSNQLLTSTNTGASTSGIRVSSSNGLDTTYSSGGGAAHAIVQPTIMCNYIIRII